MSWNPSMEELIPIVNKLMKLQDAFTLFQRWHFCHRNILQVYRI